jgi:hypothetical protein
MATRMQQRRGTAAQWVSTNGGDGPVLNAGEIGFEIDNNRFKIGDGVNHWVDLPYFANNDAISDLIDGAPQLLDTLNELAAAIGDDPAFFTTVATNLSNHQSDTTNIHGIADTSALALTSTVNSGLALKAPLESPTFTGTVSGITKSMVGLGSVDNTSDSAKPISTATQDALDLKAPLANPTFTGTVSGVTKSMVGLSNVDNTSDANKQISTATQQALDLKAPIDSPTFAGTVSGITKAMVGLANVTNTADADKPVSTATQTALDLKADIESPTFTGSVIIPDLTVSNDLVVEGDLTVNGTNFAASATSITIEDNMVQLAHQNAANTVDLGIVVSYNDGTGKHAGIVRDVSESKWKLFKDVSTEPSTVVAFGEGSLDALAVGALEATSLTVGDVSNTEIGYLEGLTGSIQEQLSSKLGATAAGFIYAPIASPTFTGTVSGVTKAMVGLGNVDNTSDANKPTSTAVQAELDLKLDITDAESTYAPLESPTFTGTVAGITKAMVGLGDVDNTSDADKEISTLTQAALDLKAPSESPTFTGTVTLPANTISQSMMNDSSVGTAELQNLAVTAEKLAADSVTNEKLNGSIEWTKLQVSSTVSATELGYVDGVTSSIQDQLDDKAPIDSPTFTGSVSGITKSMVGLGNVDNTADLDKPISDDTQTALDAKLASATAASTYAPIANPTFTGTVSGITKAMVGLTNVNDTSDADKPVSTAQATAIATAKSEAIADATAQVNAVIASAPAALNTLDELAAALGDDANFATTVTTSLAAKAPLASPTFTGTVTVAANGVAFTDGTQTKAGVPSLTTTTTTISGAYNLSTGGLTLRDQLVQISGAHTVTVPTNATTAFPVGTSISFWQSSGAGGASFAAAAGVTIYATPGAILRALYSSATLTKVTTDAWLLIGDLKA